MIITVIIGGLFVTSLFIGYQLARFEKQIDEELKK
jgi:hypothetical protein